MKGLAMLLLAACGGSVTPVEYPVVEAPGAEACEITTSVQRVETEMNAAGLGLRFISCAGEEVLALPYTEGLFVGDTWLVRSDTLRDAGARETSRPLPPIEDWISTPTDAGTLQPLIGGWLYSPRAPSSSNIFASTDPGPVLERIQAVYGQPATPIFVVPSWDSDGERPWMIAPFDADPDVFGPQVLRAYLGPGDAWLDGFAAFLWQYLQMREGSVSMDDYFDSWLAHYSEHRRSLDGQPHRFHPLAARVKSICLLPSLRLAETRSIQHRLPAHEPPWLDERGVLDVRGCLTAAGVQLAAIRYEDAAPEALLRVRSAPGDPPTVARGGSFFQVGDVITEVNRRRIQTRGDVAWALRDVDTGDRFTIVVQRNGQEARTWARRPRVGERDAVRFALIPVEADES